MIPRLVENASRYNKAKVINYNLGTMPCQRRLHSCNHPQNILLAITKYYNFLELQSFLKRIS
jgi:hypothetical protein